MFSDIATQLHGESNALYRLRDQLQAQGRGVRDLVSGNVNESGYVFPQNLVEEILGRASRDCRVYRPDSFGQRRAREAVADFYRRVGCAGKDFDPANILITPGSSLAYWYCFKLLGNAGDEILCPRPSYPLFDYIAMLAGVKLATYRMSESDGWAIDLDYLEAVITTRTRAIVLISPHNPTGHVSGEEEVAALADIARRHDLPIISDEVFSEFLLGREPLPRPAGAGAPLVFTLNGFSKMLALPGLKFGWMAVSGDGEKVREAMRALELISDTFLPVNEVVQAAAPEFFQLGNAVRFEFAMRIREAWRLTERLLAESAAVACIKPQGGFYVALKLDGADGEGWGEEEAAQRLLRENGILVHPGYFYDMDPEHLVMCFVQDPKVLGAAIPEMVKTLSRDEPGTPRTAPPRKGL
ncbi:MAG: pyridoxal phosphate-dependent aminotransferase [Acidobacteriota bacterium]|jgi:aspartate/methionine/tyrosine aminotransferase|nr:pyridoxal phosphate-dependent aminotransferase [Acidobacteriota bacterium]